MFFFLEIHHFLFIYLYILKMSDSFDAKIQSEQFSWYKQSCLVFLVSCLN